MRHGRGRLIWIISSQLDSLQIDLSPSQTDYHYSVCFFLFCSAELLPHEEAERLNDVKFLVQQLYTTLRIEEHQLSKERELIGRLEDLNSQLRPLEKVSILDCAS